MVAEGQQRQPADDATYAPKGRNTGVAVVVFPGGGYQFPAMDLEGAEICDWLTSRGITCALIRRRLSWFTPRMIPWTP